MFNVIYESSTQDLPDSLKLPPPILGDFLASVKEAVDVFRDLTMVGCVIVMSSSDV